MKKLITSFMVLFFLIGTGTKSYGQAAGDYVFTQATDNTWATVSNWSTSDGAGNLTVATRTPTATDNVFIPATSTMSTVIAKASGTATINAGSSTVTLTAANASITVGMAVKITQSMVSGIAVSTIIGLTPGTYVTAVNGTTVTLSQPVLTTGSTVSLDFYPACKNLTVNGTFTVSSQFVAFGDITVNTGGTLTQGSDLYCANINNFGTFNSTTSYRSAKSLYFGFNGAIPGLGDYTIINDGTFGDSKIDMPAVNSSGIKLLYSNRANSITIKTSTPSVSSYAFNIAQILPHSSTKTTANTNLEIKENMSLLIHNAMGLSIQNNDTCPGTTRTCTIDPGVTVYVGYNFHANRGITTNDQGNFIYNVYGTLDLGTYGSASNNTTASAANTSDFDLCMTTAIGNTGSMTFNLGDGTQANAGTLVLGSNVKLIKQRTQTMAINFNDYSTVKVTGNYGWIMNYQLLNSNNPALYLFPKNYYNLTFNGAKSILPVAPVVRGTKTYTSGAYGTSNWTAAVAGTTTTANSLYNSSTTSVLPQGSIMYTGTNYYYVPVVRTTSSYSNATNPITLAGDTILNYIQPAQLVTGSSLSSIVTSLTGTSLQLVTAPTPQNPVTNAFVQFYAIQGTSAPTGTSTNTFSPVFDGTQGLIYLGGSEFANAVILTAINSPNANNSALVYSVEKNKLVISNATAGDIATVYAISGIKVASATLTGDKTTLDIPTGIYLVKINTSVSKVVVR
ncbi:MAG: hypothetical protein P4L34_02570 [Paludibacter sp.]|nr:hypothetical protein [Paludibacter sp.]